MFYWIKNTTAIILIKCLPSSDFQDFSWPISEFHDFSRPGKQFIEIQGVFSISRTRTNPVSENEFHHEIKRNGMICLSDFMIRLVCHLLLQNFGHILFWDAPLSKFAAQTVILYLPVIYMVPKKLNPPVSRHFQDFLRTITRS